MTMLRFVFGFGLFGSGFLIVFFFFNLVFVRRIGTEKGREKEEKRIFVGIFQCWRELAFVAFCLFVKPLYTTSFAACAVVDCCGKRCSESAD